MHRIMIFIRKSLSVFDQASATAEGVSGDSRISEPISLIGSESQPEKGILADFLRKHKARIMHSILYEYDEKLQRKKERAEGESIGLKKGEAERKALAEENARLREEIERLRASSQS